MDPASARGVVTHSDGRSPIRVGTLTFEQYCDRIAAFHGSAAPGVVLGGFMVDLARRDLPPGTLFEALCETRVCLPDAIQLLTPCTTGNGRLQVVHVGRFALSLYDKHTGEGFRTFLDVTRMDPWPELRAWFFKEKTKKEQDGERLLAEIRAAGPGVLGVRPVRVGLDRVRRQKFGAVRLCPACGEAFPSSAGAVCGGCSGVLPYRTTDG